MAHELLEGYPQVILSTKASQASTPGSAVGLDEGFIIDSGVSTENLSNTAAPYQLGPGTFGVFDPNTYESLAETDINGCCDIIIAAASLRTQDKLGMHGGYKQPFITQKIKGETVELFQRQDPCQAQAAVLHIGETSYTGASPIVNATASLDLSFIVPDSGGNWVLQVNGSTISTYLELATDTQADIIQGLLMNVNIAYGAAVVGTVLTITNAITGAGGNGQVLTLIDPSITTVASETFGGGSDGSAAIAGCIPNFDCEKTYNLRLNLDGMAIRRFMTKSMYKIFSAFTGCCEYDTSGGTPVLIPVDPVAVYIQWANAILLDTEYRNFVKIIIYDAAGNKWYANEADAIADGGTAANVWDNYVRGSGYPVGGGMRITTSYVESTFSDCSFEPSDYYDVYPIVINASLVDDSGEVCNDVDICIVEECPALMPQGSGEGVIRDLITHQRYLLNYFGSDASDSRMREIYGDNQILSAVNRASAFYRYTLIYSKVRLKHQSASHNNDRYILMIASENILTAFESFMNTWISACSGPCKSLEIFDCPVCAVVPA